MKIIVDAMGGDFAPQAPVEGALAAVQEKKAEVILTGRTEDILAVLDQLDIKELPAGLEIVHADEVIEVEDNPATAFREKKNSSMTVGLNLLKEGRGDAFVSAGSTGALLSGATLLVKRIRGIRRAALAPILPTGTGAVLIDCGANAECTPEYLLQFAFQGSFYAQKALGVEKPRVALLNIGAEASKGTDLQREAYALLQKEGDEGRIHFIGNIEAHDALLGGADVIVSDGYTGNILLKACEGTAKLLTGLLKQTYQQNLLTKLAALPVAGGIRTMKKALDPNEVGGTALLGISKPVIKAHGSSNGYAVKNAIQRAVEVAETGMIQAVTENISYMKAAPGGAETGSPEADG